jgi:hypothetical protein
VAQAPRAAAAQRSDSRMLKALNMRGPVLDVLDARLMVAKAAAARAQRAYTKP